MRPFSASDILLLFDRSAGLHPIDRALLLLRYALPEADYDSLARLPLGQRDRLLIEARARNFGDRMDAFTECPACRERVEFSLSCAALLESTRTEADPVQPVSVAGVSFELRCPDSADAAIAAASANAQEGAESLLARCLRRMDGRAWAARDLSVAERAELAAALAARDPAAEILLDIACSDCGHSWQALVEIGQFLWTEIRARARRLLQEIDALARVYHWPETDILGMSDARRASYLEMALS
jgi:hypothetical protein